MRWFYSDPLEAAWMAKHYGMQFTVRKFGETTDNGLIFVLPEEISKGNYERYTIHADSLHKLEAQPGDLVFECDNYLIAESRKDPKFILPLTNYSNSSRVIQRDGKPFFWPESSPA